MEFKRRTALARGTHRMGECRCRVSSLFVGKGWELGFLASVRISAIRGSVPASTYTCDIRGNILLRDRRLSWSFRDYGRLNTSARNTNSVRHLHEIKIIPSSTA